MAKIVFTSNMHSNMSFLGKVTLSLFLLAIIAGGLIYWSNHQPVSSPLPLSDAQQSVNTQDYPEPYNNGTDTPLANGLQLHTSYSCDFTFEYPSDWIDGGYLGEDQLMSPEDVAKNEAFNEAQQDMEGEMVGHARSLYIDCWSDVEAYLREFHGYPDKHSEVSTDISLEELLSRHAATLGVEVHGNIMVGNLKAFEISTIGAPNNQHELVIQGEHIYRMAFEGDYDDLSPIVKRIIASFKPNN